VYSGVYTSEYLIRNISEDARGYLEAWGPYITTASFQTENI